MKFVTTRGAQAVPRDARKATVPEPAPIAITVRLRPESHDVGLSVWHRVIQFRPGVLLDVDANLLKEL